MTRVPFVRMLVLTSAVAAVPAIASAQTGSVTVHAQVYAPPPPSVTVTAPPPPPVVVPPAPTYVAPAPAVVAPPPQVVYAPEREPEVEVMAAPPPVQMETPPPMPAQGYVWRRGYWRWAGTQYMWIPGQWQQPPQVGVVWVEPQWVVRRGRWRFVRGHWGAGPQTVYAPAPAAVVAPPVVYAPAPRPAVVVAPPVVYGPGRGYGRRYRGGVYIAPPGGGVVIVPGGRPHGHWRR